jgi:hypothetical protein
VVLLLFQVTVELLVMEVQLALAQLGLVGGMEELDEILILDREALEDLRQEQPQMVHLERLYGQP